MFFFGAVVDELLISGIIVEQDNNDLITLIKADAIGFITESPIKYSRTMEDKCYGGFKEVVTYAKQFSIGVPAGLSKK